MSSLDDQTLALAGMFQAAVMVEQLATQGQCNAAAFDCGFDSLFTFDAETTIEVFGDISSLARGFETLAAYLGGTGQRTSRNTVYYVMSMMKIANALLDDKQQSLQLSEQLKSIADNARDFDISRDNTVLKIDRLYQDIVSHIKPRIMVRGSQKYLLDNTIGSRIRTLLLSGIRAAVLWQQLGGSKWKLFWHRKQYVATARELLDQH